MRRTKLIAAALAAMFGIAGSFSLCQAGTPLRTEDGTARYDIAVAADASAVERTAAKELQTYLKKITGADFPVTPAGGTSSRPVIAVGSGAALAVAPKLDLSLTELGDDGIVLKTVGENLVLTGATGAKRGTLYAVNEFLAKQAGVRWWTPEAETVPANPDLALQPMDVRYRPAIRTREVLAHSLNNGYLPTVRYRDALANSLSDISYSKPSQERTDEIMRFAVRSRSNGNSNKIPDSWGGNKPTLGGCHTFYHPSGTGGLITGGLIPPKKYFADHPEWFSEIKGKRQWDLGKEVLDYCQLCMTNEEMLEEMGRNVLEWLRQNPGADLVAVDINDNVNKCECAKCRAIDEAEGSPMGSVLQGVNRVADIVGAARPDVLLTTMAYLHTRQPPANIRPRDNVVIRLAVIERSVAQPIDSKSNAKIKQDLDNWSKVAGKLAIWDYWCNLKYPFTPEPRFKFFGPDIRFYRDHGAVSIFGQGSHGFSPVSDFDQMNTWLIQQLLWNPDQDDRALVKEFLAGFYGAAAPFLLEYLDLTAEALAEAVAKGTLNLVDGERKIHCFRQPNADWMTVEIMNKATALFTKARKAVAADPVLAGRVDRAQICLDHQWLLRYADYNREAKRKAVPFLGPADLESGMNAFNTRCAELGITNVGYDCFPRRLSDFLKDTRTSGEQRTDKSLLSESKVYEDFLGGKVPPLPEAMANKPGVRQVQENDFKTADGAKVMLDETASNHASAWIDPKTPSWAVQWQNAYGLGFTGRWRVFVEVRVEASPGSEGTAFVAGVYNPLKKQSLSTLAPQLNPASASATGSSAATADPRDGKYHLYNLGTHTLGKGEYIWVGNVGTVGGVKVTVNPQKVRGIFVDRVLFVPEPKAKNKQESISNQTKEE